MSQGNEYGQWIPEGLVYGGKMLFQNAINNTQNAGTSFHKIQTLKKLMQKFLSVLINKIITQFLKINSEMILS